MTTEQIIELIGQIIGFVAIGVAFLSFQVKNKNGILAIQALANFIWAIHFYMIGAMAGCILNLVGAVRNVIFAMRDKYKWLGGVWLPTVIAAIVAALSITTRESWFDVILLPSTILSTYSYCLGNERVIRNSTVFVSLTWLIFNIVSFSISGVIAEVFNLTSLTIAIIRFRKQGKEIEEIHANEKNAATNTESSKENA